MAARSSATFVSQTLAPVSEMPVSSAIFTIHAARKGETIVTHRINPEVAVAQARTLRAAGWRVRISDADGRRFGPHAFDELMMINRSRWKR